MTFKEYFSLLLENPDNFDGAAFFDKDARAFIVGKGFYAITSTYLTHHHLMKEMNKIFHQYGKVIKEPLIYDSMAFHGDFSSIHNLFTKDGKPNTNRSTILQLSKKKGLGVLVGRLWVDRSRISLWNNIKDIREDTVDYLLDVAHDYYGKDLSRYTWEAFKSQENSFHEETLVYPVFDEFLDDVHEQSTKKPKGREKDEITNPQWDKLHVMPPEKKGQAMKKLGYKPKQGVDIKDRYMKANDDERRRMGL